jgi:hypothetical protein
MMARAQAIWVVMDTQATLPKAVFTVKHEMITWLNNQLPQKLLHLRVYRYPDSPGIYTGGIVFFPMDILVQ